MRNTEKGIPYVEASDFIADLPETYRLTAERVDDLLGEEREATGQETYALATAIGNVTGRVSALENAEPPEDGWTPPTGGSTGQVLTKTSSGESWMNAADGIPDSTDDTRGLMPAGFREDILMAIGVEFAFRIGRAQDRADAAQADVDALEPRVTALENAEPPEDGWTPPAGGSTGQVLTRTAGGQEWADAADGIPDGDVDTRGLMPAGFWNTILLAVHDHYGTVINQAINEAEAARHAANAAQDDLDAATHAPTGGALVRRAASGAVNFNHVFLHSAQSTDGNSAARRDFVEAQVDSLKIVPPVATTVNRTLQLEDARKAVEVNSTSARTITIPTNASVAFPVGTVIEVYRQNTGTVTITGASGVTIRTASGTNLRAQYSVCTIRKRATNEWVLAGDLE